MQITLKIPVKLCEFFTAKSYQPKRQDNSPEATVTFELDATNTDIQENLQKYFQEKNLPTPLLKNCKIDIQMIKPWFSRDPVATATVSLNENELNTVLVYAKDIKAKLILPHS